MKTTTSARLKEIMIKRNLRQRDILELTKPFENYCDTRLSKSNLSQYLSGMALPSQRKLTLLSMALNVTEPWLMGFDTDINKLDDISKEEKELLIAFRSLSRLDKDEILNFIDFKIAKKKT